MDPLVTIEREGTERMRTATVNKNMSDGKPLNPKALGRMATRGVFVVIGLLLLGLIAASSAILFQRNQTRRCLEFFGISAAHQINHSLHVELWQLNPNRQSSELIEQNPLRILDISKARGLVHLRRGLVEDANYDWSIVDEKNATDEHSTWTTCPTWEWALVFSNVSTHGTTNDGATVLVLDLTHASGSLAVVGRPGRIGLGWLRSGLATWIQDTANAPPVP